MAVKIADTADTKTMTRSPSDMPASKPCFKCSEVKPLSDFYAHPQMKDGRLNKCKDCTKSDVKRNYSKRRDQYAAYERKHRERHPERYKARSTLNNAALAGLQAIINGPN